MLASLLLAFALAGGSDVSVTGDVPGSLDAVLAELADLRTLERITPPSCGTRWVHGPSTAGLGGTARWTLRAGPWQERVTGVLVAITPTRVDIEHRTKRGVARYTTRWSLAPAGDATRVTVTTYLEPPPRPWVRAFEARVRPGWQACHAAQLEALGGSLP